MSGLTVLLMPEVPAETRVYVVEGLIEAGEALQRGTGFPAKTGVH